MIPFTTPFQLHASYTHIHYIILSYSFLSFCFLAAQTGMANSNSILIMHAMDTTCLAPFLTVKKILPQVSIPLVN